MHSKCINLSLRKQNNIKKSKHLFFTVTASTSTPAMPMSTTDIPIKYINDTGSTDFSVVVFTKNFSVDTPKTYFAAWEVIRVQTSSGFVYPITTSVGASYQHHDQHNTMGPFGAEPGSTWEINQNNPATAPLIMPGLYACSATNHRMCYCKLVVWCACMRHWPKLITVNSLLTDAPNSGLTRYSGHSSMHGLISLY